MTIETSRFVRRFIPPGLLLLTIASAAVGAGVETTAPRVVAQVPVYAVDGRFGGWPANHGIWAWGNEIVVGFSAGYYKDLGPGLHAIDRHKPEYHLLARSLDGGHSWSIEDPSRQGELIGTRGMRHGTIPPGSVEKELRDCPGGIDFTHPDFAMTLRMSNVDGGVSRFYVSTDRAHTWAGPFRLPLCGQLGIAARTDYLVNGQHDCMVFVTASKRNGKEGRPVCLRTTDGAKSWRLVSTIGPEPPAYAYAIMPSTVRLSPSEILTTIRYREKDDSKGIDDAWIDAYLSTDNAQSWRYLNHPATRLGEGNPPALLRLRDGRLCLTYGVRTPPLLQVEARLSRDDGKTWGKPFVLKGDGATRDLGYPRTVQRPDGKIVAIYYFHDKSRVERTIQATIWDPGD
jgi:BNR repeat-like domain